MPSARSIHVALLAGGRGTRFWPLSRSARPKQVLDVTGEGPLLRRTFERVAALCPRENVLVVTTPPSADAARRMLRLSRRNVLVEPDGRNTAASVGLAALVASRRDPDAVVLALPSDHHVRRAARLRAALRAGAAAARRLRGLVLVGLDPERPEPGFGYIVPGGPPDARSRGARPVARFVEKPDAARAARLIRDGALWNSGMFCLHAAAALEEIAAHLPDLGRALDALRPHVDRPTWGRALADAWPGVPSASFDRAVLEPSRRVHVIDAGAIGWSDVGSWDALAELLPADPRGNRSRGAAVAHESDGCVVVVAPGRTAVVLGARDLLVVDAGDVVLVAPRAAAAGLPALVARLERERPDLT